MQSRDELEKRVAELERQAAAFKGGAGVLAVRGIRKRSAGGFGELPFCDIALGPDLLSFGGLSVGLLAAIGGLAATGSRGRAA